MDDGAARGSVGDPARLDAVLSLIRSELLKALATPSTVHGWRAQALFASLVQALDACQMLMTLDSGEVFIEGDGVKLPDYLLVVLRGVASVLGLPGGGVVEVEAAGAVEGFFGGAGGQAAGQVVGLVVVVAGPVDREAPGAG